MQSDMGLAEGDRSSTLPSVPQGSQIMVSTEVQTDDSGPEGTPVALQVGNAGISKSHR